jgi:hypothetical protein
MHDHHVANCVLFENPDVHGEGGEAINEAAVFLFLLAAEG